MSDFCSKCHLDHGFPGEPEIRVEEMFNALEEGYMTSGFICEGCGMVAVAKQNNNCLVARDLGGDSLVWDPYED